MAPYGSSSLVVAAHRRREASGGGDARTWVGRLYVQPQMVGFQGSAEAARPLFFFLKKKKKGQSAALQPLSLAVASVGFLNNEAVKAICILRTKSSPENQAAGFLAVLSFEGVLERLSSGFTVTWKGWLEELRGSTVGRV